jgi:hypothetical protein
MIFLPAISFIFLRSGFLSESSSVQPIEEVVMKRITRSALLIALSSLNIPLFAAGPRGFDLAVVMDGSNRPEYPARGTVYVEAVRGREYQLRITNPLGVRVAVALSVDGLNTIDAKHTDPMKASKWVLDPYETQVISGWQVNGSTARRFEFTGEKHSYGAALGQTDNLGVIEAVFYKERELYRPLPRPMSYDQHDGERRPMGSGAVGSAEAPPASQAEAGANAPREEKSKSSDSMKRAAESRQAPAPKLSDEYAATGMGERTRNDVWNVSIDLDPRPAATVRIRYEFRAQLARLGVLPRIPTVPEPLARREDATGFDRYCPEPVTYRER